MKTNICINILILFLFLSCSYNKNQMPPESKLYLVDSLNVFLGIPVSMQLYDNYLYIMDLFGENGMIKVVDVSQDSLITTFAKRGEGPNEYLTITNIDICEYNNQIIVGLFDASTKTFKSYIQDSIFVQQGDVIPYESKKIDADFLIGNYR